MYEDGDSNLDKTTLHVSRLGRLHGGVDQTLPASHCVEEELGGGETGVETVLHKATCSRILGCTTSSLTIQLLLS